MGQSLSSGLGKRKEFEGPRTPKYDKGGSSGQKQSRTNRQRIRSSYPIRICNVCGKLHEAFVIRPQEPATIVVNVVISPEIIL